MCQPGMEKCKLFIGHYFENIQTKHVIVYIRNWIAFHTKSYINPYERKKLMNG